MSNISRFAKPHFDGSLAAIICLTIYLALSVTPLPALVIFLPLAASALCLLAPLNPHLERETLNLERKHWLAFTGFLASYLLSTLFSYNIPVSLNAVAVLFPGLLISYIIAQIPQPQLPLLFYSLTALVLAPALVTVGMFCLSGQVLPGAVFEDFRTPALTVPNDLLLGVIFLPAPVIMFLKSPGVLVRTLALISISLLLVALWLVESRLGILVLAVLITLLLGSRLRFTKFIIALVVLFGVVLALDWLLQLGVAENFNRLRVENARISIWLAGLSRWLDNPLLGYGPGHFEVAYRLGLIDLKLPGWVLVEGRMVPWAHNLFIESLVERGMFGFLTQTALLIAIFSRLLFLGRFNVQPAAICYSASMLCFSAFLVASFFELTLQRIWVANTLFIFIGLAWRAKDRPPDQR